ncbi:hypothetical protein BCR22_00675 [Enterococcus plantarum]|uniref:pectate lyase-like adhesive domain-containing protein n=1 Tax=Enterococcus plantarum TaxID=1077675 RepID=UPI00084D54B9|nr:pectate lyase-like adhesive domain-containing protein [Enterococcus plantarum]OEG20957.1 hypothetical protein BCR22_00675 [Enterococcus plantarum]
MKQMKSKRIAIGIGSLFFMLTMAFLSYQAYWFFHDFGKNKYSLNIEEYIHPEMKEKIGIIIELSITNPKEETITIKSKNNQLITPETLEAVKSDSLEMVTAQPSGNNGVKIKIKQSDKKTTLKIPLPIVRDSKDKIEIYRHKRKIKTMNINYTSPKEKTETSSLIVQPKMYATTGSITSTNSYEMFSSPSVLQIQNYTPSSTKRIVTTYQQLIAAIKDNSTDHIEFGANISGTTALPEVNRSLMIDGKGFTFTTGTGNNRSFQLGSAKRFFVVKNMNVDSKNNSGLIRSTQDGWTILTENIQNTYASNAGTFIDASRSYLVMKGQTNWNSGTTGNNVVNAKEILITEQADIRIQGRVSVIRMHPGNRINTVFVIEKGSKLALHSREGQAIYANSQGYVNKVHFEARDEGTVLNATSNGALIDYYGATISICGSSNNSSEATKSATKVTSGAKVNIHSLGLNNNKKRAQPAMINQVTNGNFYVDGKGSELNLTSEGESNNIGAVLRFRLVGGQTFLLTNKGKVSITKKNGSASGIRLYGQNNQFFVKSGGYLQINNQADKSDNGGPVNGSDTGGKQGIQFPIDGSGKTSIFSLEGKESEVYINASLGPALWTQSGSLRFLVGKDTVFRAEGHTYSQNSGVIQSAGQADFELDQPSFYDIRNNRKNGGQVFSNGSNNGTFKVKKSYLSVWEIKNGLDLDQDPDAYWAPISYTLKGRNFETIVSTDYVDEFNQSTYKGANHYARMSGNSSAPIVDELRIPTNADKKIYGHVSVKVGYGEEIRDAWEKEVLVKVKITRGNTVLMEKEVLTKGYKGAKNLPGVQQWDEQKPRGGIVVVELADFIKTGDKVEIIGATRGRNRDSLEVPSLLVKPVTTVDVTPPMELTIEKDSISGKSDTLTNASKQIKGTIDLYDKRHDNQLTEKMYIFAKVNNQFLESTLTEVTSEGKSITDSKVNWTINLPRYLASNETIEIFAKDSNVLDDLKDKEQLNTYSKDPNGIGGNSMPSSSSYGHYKGYHDAVKSGKQDDRFKPAKLMSVEDIMPEELSLENLKVEASTKEKDPVTNKEVDITRIGSLLTYSGEIRSANNHPSESKKVIRNVLFTTEIPADLDDSSSSFTFFFEKNGKPIIGQYDQASRILSVNVDTLTKDDVLTFNFSTKVTDVPEGSPEFSLTVKAQGKSPNEEPFIPGDFILENQKTLTDEATMTSPMPKKGSENETESIIEDGKAYVRLSVINKRLTAYYRNVTKIVVKIDGDTYRSFDKTSGLQELSTAEKSIVLDIPIDQHRRNITAEYYYPDPQNTSNSLKAITTWNKKKWNKDVNDALDPEK